MAVHIQKLEEDVREGMRLGRHIVHDPKSKDFPVEEVKKLVSIRHTTHGLPLDQGKVGSCTAEAATGALNSDPFYEALKLAHPFDQKWAYQLYHFETELHPSDGVYPPSDPGGCGLWVASAMKHHGIIKEYRHAFTTKQAQSGLQTKPGIVGMSWLSGCDSPDSEGIVKYTGNSRGGHEILLDELDLERQLFGFTNSWGPSWGLGGRFFMSISDFEAAMQDQGDITFFTV